MAYVNSSRAASFSLADRFSGYVAQFKASLARRAVYNQTVRELVILSRLIAFPALSHRASKYAECRGQLPQPGAGCARTQSGQAFA
mgnify:CR=1 FL=1